MLLGIDTRKHRHPDHAIDPIFAARWSPRAMSGEPVADADLHRCLEAARWAASSFNEQPWRFLYARRGTPHFDTFLGLLLPANQAWAKDAGVLLALVAKTNFSHNDSPNAVHMFDCGAAWHNFALQGAQLGLVVHAMAGFDWARAPGVLRVPAGYAPAAMIAVGRPGRVENLPEPLRSRELPSPRKKIAEFAFEGPFPG
ncbi:MAG: nitroreductase family protein [Phycisphaerales bacterium]|nr:nitroreductase family protein [Phycisphaerales bacterium]